MPNEKPSSPFYEDQNLMIPRDRRETNAWSRHYYTTNPTIHNFIDEIVSQVYSGFRIIPMNNCSNDDLQLYKNEFFDKQGNFKHVASLRDIVKELNLVGESFTYIELNEKSGVFKLIIQNPDYVEVKRNLSGDAISLIPDEELRKVVNSKDKADIELVKRVDKDIIKYVKSGKSIPLSPSFVTHFAIKNSPYDLRGTSKIVKYFKSLLLDDKLRELAFENNANHITSKDFINSLEVECSSNAFRDSLHNQRKSLEEFIVNKIFTPWQKIHGVKGSVGIEWTNVIDTTKFKF